MFSILNPTILYDDISSDITECDVDVVSDLWNIDGFQVYRGQRDPRYDHASVYWMYNEDLERVGCCEHDIKDPANYKALWFRESIFGTLLQEDGWEVDGDIWSKLPEEVFERCLNEEWTTPKTFLEHCCLYGPVRVVTPDMIVKPVDVYTCKKCGLKSLTSQLNHEMEVSKLDYPKVFFVDNDMVVHKPPQNSRVLKQLVGDGGLSL